MVSPREPGPILLIGRSGQLGWELERVLATLAPVTATDRSMLELAAVEAVRACVRAVRPALIVNAAAYTAVDRAESEPMLARAINAIAPAVLAEEAKRLAIPLIHFSTDYVFDGRERVAPDGSIRPYREQDPASPLNVYGRSKREGEEAIAAAHPVHVILRTAWVYGRRGRNFLLTIQRLAAERDELRVVDDQIGSPTWARLLAEATGQIVAQTWAIGGTAAVEERAGLYHLTSAGHTSWHGFAAAILADRRGDAATAAPPPRLVAIATEEYPTPARRPACAVLDWSRAAHTFGVRLPDWRSGLRLCLAEA